MYNLSPGITMRSTIPAYSYRHELNFIPGIVKTRIDCYSGISNPSLIVMARTPEVARVLDVPLGSSVDTTRGPSLGMGGGLPLDPAPWVRERYIQSSSSYHSGMIKNGGEPDYRWSLPSPCKESTGLPCPTSLTSHPSVKETRHHFADRVGVTGEDENSTVAPP